MACQLDTVDPRRLNRRVCRTFMPHLGQWDPVPPLVDSELRTAAEVREEEAMVPVVDIEDTCTATCSFPEQKADAGGVAGLAVGGAVADVWEGFHRR